MKKDKRVPNPETRTAMAEADSIIIARLRREITDLTADRDHWMHLYQQAANAALRLTPPTRFKKPGPLPEPVTSTGDGPSTSGVVSQGRDITAESMSDLNAEFTLSLEELWAKVDAGGQNLDEVLIFEEMDKAKGTQGSYQDTHALLALLGASSEDVEAGRIATFAEVLSAIRNVAKVRAERRLRILAEVMETPQDRLGRFIDMLGTQPLTEDRIVGAQYALGLPTPVASHLAFPLMALPPNREARELLEEFGLRKQAMEERNAAPLNPDDPGVREYNSRVEAKGTFAAPRKQRRKRE